MPLEKKPLLELPGKACKLPSVLQATGSNCLPGCCMAWHSGGVGMEYERQRRSTRCAAPLDVALLRKVGAHHNGVPSRGLDLLRYVLCCAR